MENVLFIGNLALLAIVMIEVRALLTGLIHAYRWPAFVRLVRDQHGKTTSRTHAKALTPAERLQMFKTRWFFMSPCLHEVHCMMFGEKACWNGTLPLASALLCMELFKQVLPANEALCVGALFGLVAFVSTQGRKYFATMKKLDAANAQVQEVLRSPK